MRAANGSGQTDDEFMGLTAISRELGGRSRSTIRLWMLSGRIPSVVVAGRRVAHRSAVERVKAELQRSDAPPAALGS